MTDNAANLFQAIIEKLFPLAVNSAAEGVETVDQFGAYLDITSNTLLGGGEDENGQEVGMGAVALNAQEEAVLQVAVNDWKQQELQDQTFYAKYLDINNHNSILSSSTMRVASNIPMSQGPIQSIGLNFSFLGGISNLLNFNKKASASSLPQNREELFGVRQYGFPLNDKAYTVDGDTLDAETCKQYEELRQASKRIDEDTGEEYYTESNPCLLDAIVIDSLTKIFDLDPVGTGAFNPTGIQTTGPGEDTSNVQCAPGTTLVKEREYSPFRGLDTYFRLCRTNGITVSSVISANVKALVEDAMEDGIDFSNSGGFRSTQGQIDVRKNNCGTSNYAIYEMPSSSCSPPTARPGRSNHERGEAIDFVSSGSLIRNRSNAGYRWLEANAEKYGLKNLPSEAWHWSTNGQ